MKVPWFFGGIIWHVSGCADTWPKMCTYFAIYLYIPAHGITNFPYQYIFSVG